MTDSAVMSAAREGGAVLALRLLWPLLAVLLVIRLALAASCNLLPDEAFYWVWTRHLAGGYLDHPPMIAYLMWLSTRVLGNSQIGVRLPCVLMSLASIALIVALVRRQLKDDRAAGYVAIMWLASPLAAVTGLIFTPDTPSIFFSICARLRDWDMHRRRCAPSCVFRSRFFSLLRYSGGGLGWGLCSW